MGRPDAEDELMVFALAAGSVFGLIVMMLVDPPEPPMFA